MTARIAIAIASDRSQFGVAGGLDWKRVSCSARMWTAPLALNGLWAPAMVARTSTPRALLDERPAVVNVGEVSSRHSMTGTRRSDPIPRQARSPRRRAITLMV